MHISSAERFIDITSVYWIYTPMQISIAFDLQPPSIPLPLQRVHIAHTLVLLTVTEYIWDWQIGWVNEKTTKKSDGRLSRSVVVPCIVRTFCQSFIFPKHLCETCFPILNWLDCRHWHVFKYFIRAFIWSKHKQTNKKIKSDAATRCTNNKCNSIESFMIVVHL